MKDMFRKAFFAFVLAALATAFCAAPVEAKQSKAIKRFNQLGYQALTYNYYGYLYANYARQIAIAYGYSDAETGYYLYYGEQYSLYGYQYGSTGMQKKFADYLTGAADLCNASWQYEYNIYSYTANTLYPQYPDVAVALEPLYYAYAFNYYAEIYYDAAVKAVEPKKGKKK
jgi:hypothetical protein